MATETIPTWDESEEVKTPTWDQSEDFTPPRWEESEPHIAPIGQMPPSPFGAGVQPPQDFAGVSQSDPFTPVATLPESLTESARLAADRRRRQVEEETWAKMSAGERLQSDLANTARAGIEGVGLTPKALAITANTMPISFGPGAPMTSDLIEANRRRTQRTPAQLRQDITSDPLYQAGGRIQEFGEKTFPNIQPESATRPLAAIGEGVASTVTMLPGAVAGPLGVAALGALQNGASAYEEAKQFGADEDKALDAFWINALTGTTEAVPLARIFKRIDKASGGNLSTAVRAMTKSGLEEGAQETFQTIVGNIAAKHLYDEEREYLDGIAKGGGVGFGTGFLLAGLGIGTGATARKTERGARRVANMMDFVPRGAGIASPETQGAGQPSNEPITTGTTAPVTPPIEAQTATMLEKLKAADEARSKLPPLTTETIPTAIEGLAKGNTLDATRVGQAVSTMEHLEALRKGRKDNRKNIEATAGQMFREAIESAISHGSNKDLNFSGPLDWRKPENDAVRQWIVQHGKKIGINVKDILESPLWESAQKETTSSEPPPAPTGTPPEQEELFQTKAQSKEADDIFDRAEVGDEAAFDELHERLHSGIDPEELARFGRGDPNTVPNAAAFERLFEDAFAKSDFDRILNAIKATSDVSVWKPLLQKFFKAQAKDPLAAKKAEWMRAVFNGTRPEGALPPKAPKPPPAAAAPPPPRQPPRGGQKPPPGSTPPPGGSPPPAPPPPRIEAEGIKGGKPKSAYQILKDFSKAIGKALEVRRQKPNVAGTYAPGSTLTTIRFASDLDTAAHELAGHWTDDRYGIGKQWMNSRTPSPYDTELAKFWIHGSYRPGMSRRMARAEGIAEFIRAYVVNPAAAKTSAPNFTAYFEKSIPPKALNAIKSFSTDVRTWVGADPLIRGSMAFRRNPPGVAERLWETLKGEGYGFTVSPIDRLRLWFDDSLQYPMKAWAQMRKIRKDRGGPDLNPEQDFEILARLLPSHDARMTDQLENGLVDFRTSQIINAQGKLEVSRPNDPVTNQPMSLPWIMGGFDTSNIEAFNREKNLTEAMMVHQRTLAKAQQLGRTENISGLGAGMMSDVKVAREFMQALDADPALKTRLSENARRYRLWADHNLRMLVDAGRITPELYAQIKRDNEQYVAMNRISEEFNIARGGRSSKGMATAKQPIKRFKGSSLEIRDVYANLLEQTNLIQMESFRNAAMRSFVDGFINTRQLHGANRMDLAQFGSRATSKDPNTIKVWRNGKAEYWKFDHDIHESLKGLGELGTHKFIDLLSMPSTFSRYMITHGPQFMLRNPVRDTFQRSVVSNNGSKPWDILSGYSEADFQRYNVFGGGQFGNYIVDKHVWNRELERVTRELVKDPKNIIYSPLKLKHAWEELAKKSEAVGRIAEFRRAFDKGKERGMDDYNAALFAASEARGLLDFAKAGTIMRVINRLIPFSNARIRGLARSAFQIRTKPGRFALHWSMFVLFPVLATWMWNRQDEETWEEYQQLPSYRKDFFWNFKIGNHWLSIPRPHELGVMAGGVERALNRLLGDKRGLEGYGKSVTSAYMPVGDPVELTGPLRTWLELEFNRDTFRNRDIIPHWEKDLDPELREGAKTASTAGKSLAAALNTTGLGADPRQVDYFLNSLGGLGQITTTASSPTRTAGELLAKATGYQSEVPGSGSRDVQWILDWSKSKGFTNHKLVNDMKALRKEVLNEKDPAKRSEKSKTLRDYAAQLRPLLEQYDEQQKSKQP